MFASEALPQHLKERYNILIEDLRELQEDYENYKRESIPVWYVIPRYIQEMNLSMDYDEQQDMASRAMNLSMRRAVVVRTVNTPMGVLRAFSEDILDEVLDQMSEPDEE
jgi:hypothetical protein